MKARPDHSISQRISKRITSTLKCNNKTSENIFGKYMMQVKKKAGQTNGPTHVTMSAIEALINC